MTQFPVNSNITTTGHKLQGQTKPRMIIGKRNYRYVSCFSIHSVVDNSIFLNGSLLPIANMQIQAINSLYDKSSVIRTNKSASLQLLLQASIIPQFWLTL